MEVYEYKVENVMSSEVNNARDELIDELTKELEDLEIEYEESSNEDSESGAAE